MQPSPATNDHSKFRCEQSRPGPCIDRYQKTTLFEVVFTHHSVLILANPLALQVNYLLPKASQISDMFR